MSGSHPVLVTGASGRLGGQIIELLLDRGETGIIATSRNPEKLSHLTSRGVEVRPLDFDDTATNIARAFEGARRLLLISTHAIGRRGEQIKRVVSGAQAAGVGHVVYTSAASPSPDPISTVVSDHFWSEHAIMRSGLSWTFMRHNMYTEHTLLFLPPAIKSRRLRTALGAGARAYVTRTDCARADAAAVSGSWTDCRIYDVGGPEAVTTERLLTVVEQLTGIRVDIVPTDDATALREFKENNLPPGFAEAAVGFDVCARRGYHALVTPTFSDLCGIVPESVASYLARHVDLLLAGNANTEV